MIGFAIFSALLVGLCLVRQSVVSTHIIVGARTRVDGLHFCNWSSPSNCIGEQS